MSEPEPTKATEKGKVDKKQLEELILGGEKIRRLKKKHPKTYKQVLDKLVSAESLGAEVKEGKVVWPGLTNPGRSAWVNSFTPEDHI
ncbi:MAG: hypothetical protein GF334_07720, partial [Candidatus Altiarchaeales archaeon]|nr:hypothetical protein [Candidatus Altiarchaeales archaeon]